MQDEGLIPRVSRLPTWQLCFFFFMLAVPYGAVVGFAAGWVPLVLTNEGLEMKSIGWYAAAVAVPTFLRFLYSPIIDVWLRRRTWLFIVTSISAVFLCVAIFQPLPQRFPLFVALIFVAKLFSGLISSAYGGLMATLVDPKDRGKVAGWNYAGNLGGMGFVWFLTIWLGSRPKYVAIIVFLSMMLPGSLALVLPESKRAMDKITEVFGNVFRDIVKALRSKSVLIGMLFCLSPVGTVVLTDFFSSMGDAYKANKDIVAVAGGALGGLVSAVGSILGGYVCDRYNRRYVYLLSGLLTAAVCVCLVFAPKTPTMYVFGVLAYFSVAGLAYAAFNAVVLESIGHAGKSASAQYALFVSAGNFAIFYMKIFDTRFDKVSIMGAPEGMSAVVGENGLFRILGILRPLARVNGILASDAVLNVIGVVVLFVVWTLIARHRADKKLNVLTPGKFA